MRVSKHFKSSVRFGHATPVMSFGSDKLTITTVASERYPVLSVEKKENRPRPNKLLILIDKRYN